MTPSPRDFVMILENGERITAASDIELAELWMRHTYGPQRWDALTPYQQAEEVSDALAELRRSYDEATRSA